MYFLFIFIFLSVGINANEAGTLERSDGEEEEELTSSV